MGKEGRAGIAVKLGRLYQSVSPLFSFVDYLFSLCIPTNKNKLQVICLLAAPRSGSTLTYQILNSGIKNIHLTNIWNLLYATPLIGGLISKFLVKNYPSSFSSRQGFVPGLKGEAEGLKFWTFWSGQSLSQDADWNSKKVKKLHSKIHKIVSEDEAFITGYLGHVFCIDNLRKIFPNILFIHLQRNLLSNARSIYNASPNEWFSSRPHGNTEVLKSDRFTQIAYQIISIHKEIWENRGEDYIVLNVNKIGENPSQSINEIIAFAKEKNISLIPANNYESLKEKSFQIKKTDPSADEINKALFEALSKAIENVQNKTLKANLEQLLHD